MKTKCFASSYAMLLKSAEMYNLKKKKSSDRVWEIKCQMIKFLCLGSFYNGLNCSCSSIISKVTYSRWIFWKIIEKFSKKDNRIFWPSWFSEESNTTYFLLVLFCFMGIYLWLNVTLYLYYVCYLSGVLPKYFVSLILFFLFQWQMCTFLMNT